MPTDAWRQRELPLEQDLNSLIEDLVRRFGVTEVELVPIPEDEEDNPR